MIKFKLPVIVQSLNGEQLLTEEKEIDILIDTSIYSEHRWNTHFPEQAERETLMSYINRVVEQSDKAKGLSGSVFILNALKALYCLIEANDFPTFKSFCQAFNLASDNAKTAEKLKQIFSVALSSSATTPKN